MGSRTPKAIIKEAEKCVRTLVRKFCRRPSLFYNEAGLQHYFFATLYRVLGGGKEHVTLDGCRTNVVHPEYGSYDLVRTNPPRRAWYDMVVLNPAFIQRNTYDRVISRSHKENKKGGFRSDDVLCVFELKYIVGNVKKYMKELEKDYKHLCLAKEAKRKYMVVFSSVAFDENWFDDFSFSRNFRLVYVEIGGKIVCRPRGWME